MTTWTVTRVWRNIEADTAMDALEAAPVLGHDAVNVRPADAAPYLAPEIAITRLTKERDQARANEVQLLTAIDVAINLLWPGANVLIARDYLVQVIGSDPIDARQDLSRWQGEIDRQHATWTQEEIDRVTTASREQHAADADLFNDDKMCMVCGGWIVRIDSPTGGWWAHRVHPPDQHEAVGPNPDMAELEEDAEARGEDARACKCGHPRAAHVHYRAGTDCGFNDCDCEKYRRS